MARRQLAVCDGCGEDFAGGTRVGGGDVARAVQRSTILASLMAPQRHLSSGGGGGGGGGEGVGGGGGVG